ncbi:hypothetical protein B0H13DRAFT_1923415 [Mycena leptocephala]|nr:hypothetical protein B0H13DRAFT_1923415 [Mycena leptocephala]
MGFAETRAKCKFHSIAYTAALPIQELHQVRNYTACTFDPPPAFLARFLSGLSPKNSGALHWWTTGIKHAGLRWVQVLMFHPRTLNTCIWGAGHRGCWLGGQWDFEKRTLMASNNDALAKHRVANEACLDAQERMGCRVIRGRRQTSPLPSCSVEVADPEHQHPHQGCPFPVASDNCRKIFKPSGIGLEQKIPRNVGLQVQHYLVVEDFGNVWPAGNLVLNPLRSSETC